jgi:hypothetical protein
MTGKQYGIVIDHAGAVFRHGFPDEDTEWTLEGNVDENYKAKHDADSTPKAFYCKRCELAYKGSEACPSCGKMPSKPPKSIFAPPPVRPRNELLTEAERGSEKDVFSEEEKVKHWLRCVATQFNQGGSFKRAATIFKQKYGTWPGNGYPCNPVWERRGEKVRDVYPDFGRRKSG